MRFRLIAKITVLLALVLFFTPFIMVSCSAVEVKESYTGVDLMIRNIDDDDEFVSSEAMDFEEFKPNYWLIGAFGLGVATLVILFIKRASLIAGITSLLAVILLIVFRFTFVSFYELQKELEEIEKLIVIESQWGYILCVIFMVLTSVMAFFEFKKEKIEKIFDCWKKKIGKLKEMTKIDETEKAEDTEITDIVQ